MPYFNNGFCGLLPIMIKNFVILESECDPVRTGCYWNTYSPVIDNLGMAIFMGDFRGSNPSKINP